VLDDTVVSELIVVKETKLDNEGSIVADSDDRSVSVKRGVAVIKLDNETELELDGELVAKSLVDIVDDDKPDTVNKPVEESKGDDVIDDVASCVAEISAEAVPDDEALSRIDRVTDGEAVTVAASDIDGELETEPLEDVDNDDKVVSVIALLEEIVAHIDLVAVTEPVEEDNGDIEMVCVAKCVVEIVTVVVSHELELPGLDGVTDNETVKKAAAVIDGKIVVESL